MYLQNYNENPRLFYNYAKVLEANKEFLQAEKYYARAITIDNGLGDVHQDYATLLENHTLKYDVAENHFKRSLECDPNNAKYNYNFGAFLMDFVAKYEEGLHYCEKACQLQPNNSWAHYWKSKALYLLKRFDESVDQCLLCLDLNKKEQQLR